MITKEDLKPCFMCGGEVRARATPTWKGDFVYCDKCVMTYECNPEFWNTRWAHKKIEELLKERDEALRRAEAYREVGKHWMYCFKDISRGRMKEDYSGEVDEEAEKILKLEKEKTK